MKLSVAPTCFMISIARADAAMVKRTVLEITNTAATNTISPITKSAIRNRLFQRSRTCVHCSLKVTSSTPGQRATSAAIARCLSALRASSSNVRWNEAGSGLSASASSRSACSSPSSRRKSASACSLLM